MSREAFVERTLEDDSSHHSLQDTLPAENYRQRYDRASTQLQLPVRVKGACNYFAMSPE
jgi:hypothetical protein